jgi:phosphate transport system permease protein
MNLAAAAPRVARRKILNRLMSVTAGAMTLIALLWLALVLWTLIGRGVGGLRLSLFLQDTPPPGSQGGLANALFGSLVMTALAIILAAPVGVLAGTYLAEIGRANPLSSAVRFVNDMLLAAPSIIIGLFVYQILVVPAGHFSAWAGSLALAIIALPIIVRTTEDMLKLVPDQLREAAMALGAPRWWMITRVTWQAALAGLLTGVLLAVARISGETAPLLFTALNNQFWSGDLNAPMANLPVVIYQFALSPYHDWQDLAWTGAFLITLAVLTLDIIARSLTPDPSRP